MNIRGPPYSHPTLACTVAPNYSRAFRMAASFLRVTPKGVVVPEADEDINEDNKKGNPTTGGDGGTEGGIPVPGNTIEG